MQPGRQIADFTASYKRRADVRAKYGAGRNTCEPPGGALVIMVGVWAEWRTNEHIIAVGKENWTELKSTSGRRRQDFLG